MEGLASGFSIFPNRVELNANNYRQTFTLTNLDEGLKVIQVRLYHWSQKGGVDVKEISKDLIVMPPVVKLPKGVEKTVRVGFRKPIVADNELTYRLEFKEIPKKSETTGVSLAFTQSVPIYYNYNSKWKARLASKVIDVTSIGAQIEISNSGFRHTVIKQIQLVDSEKQKTIWQSDNAFAILSNSLRVFSISNYEPQVKYLLEMETRNHGVLQHTLYFEK